MTLAGLWKAALVGAMSATCCFAVTPVIGVASAIGTFSINSAQVEGNANVFDGSEIRTGLASSDIYLHNGAAVTLGTNSAGTLYKDHILLQQGATKVTMTGYSVQAGKFRMTQAQPATQAVIRLDGPFVDVAALSGSVNIYSASGALLTHLTAGNATEFDNGSVNPPQAGGQSGATATTPEEEARRRRRRLAGLYLILGTTMAGLGLAVDAILQPGPTSP